MAKYVFLGTPDFAATILEGLIQGGFAPSLVITNPDRPVGRKKIITPPHAKVVAEHHHIPVWQPEKLTIDEYKKRVGSFDFAIVAAYGQIIKKEVINVPRLKTIGVHPSLLPKYRGASPIQGVLLSGDTETGVTLYMLQEGVDDGPILAVNKLQIENNDYYKSLEKKLAQNASELLIKTIPQFLDEKIIPKLQDELSATITKKFETEDGEVNLEKDTPEIILRKVRALNPEPGVYTFKNGKRMKILEADLVDGKLVLKKIQFEGEKPKSI